MTGFSDREWTERILQGLKENSRRFANASEVAPSVIPVTAPNFEVGGLRMNTHAYARHLEEHGITPDSLAEAAYRYIVTKAATRADLDALEAGLKLDFFKAATLLVGILCLFMLAAAACLIWGLRH